MEETGGWGNFFLCASSGFTVGQRSAVLVPHVTGLLDEDHFVWIGVVRDPKGLDRSFAFDVVGESDETAIRHADAAGPLRRGVVFDPVDVFVQRLDDIPLAVVSHHKLFAQGVVVDLYLVHLVGAGPVVQFVSFESRVKESMVPL